MLKDMVKGKDGKTFENELFDLFFKYKEAGDSGLEMIGIMESLKMYQRMMAKDRLDDMYKKSGLSG